MGVSAGVVLSLPTLHSLAPDLSRDELLGRLVGVLSFANRNLAQLDGTVELWAEELGSLVRLLDKVVIETSILVLLASRIADPSEPLREVLSEVRHKLASFASSERTRVLLLRFPYTALSLGTTRIVLSSLGDPDEVTDELIRQAIGIGYVDIAERLPFRTLDVRWVRSLLHPDASITVHDILPYSILSSRTHPIYMTREDAYAYTHSIFYLTDFGTRPLPDSLDHDHIAGIVDAALAWHLMTEDLDLLAEFLMCASLMNRPWSPYARFAWHLLARTWDELGILPSPSFEPASFSALGGPDASAYAFKHFYHTTYLGGLLCALLARHPQSGSHNQDGNWQTPLAIDPALVELCECAIAGADEFCRSGGVDRPQVPDNRGPVAFSETVSLAEIVARVAGRASWSRPDARWLQILPDAPLNEEQLELVLSDAIIIQAVKEYDLPLLSTALVDATRLSQAPSLTLVAATTFLAHQQVPSGAIGAHFVLDENLNTPLAAQVTHSLATCLAIATRYLARYSAHCKGSAGSMT